MVNMKRNAHSDSLTCYDMKIEKEKLIILLAGLPML